MGNSPEWAMCWKMVWEAQSYPETLGPCFPGLWGKHYLINQLHLFNSRPLHSWSVTKSEKRTSRMGPRSLIVWLGSWTWPLSQDVGIFSVRWSSVQFRGWIHMHTYLHRDTRTYIETCMHIHVHKQRHIQTCKHTVTHAHTHLHTNTHAHRETCVYRNTCVNTHVHICTQIQAYMNTEPYRYAYIYPCVHRCTYIYRNTSTLKYMCTCGPQTGTYVDTHMHTYVHIHAHKYTYIAEFSAHRTPLGKCYTPFWFVCYDEFRSLKWALCFANLTNFA